MHLCPSSRAASLLLPLACTLAAPTAAAAKKQHVHDHGHAKLSVAVDGNTVALDFDTPAQGLYGFEHEPKTAAEQKIVSAANAKFQTGANALFTFAPELGCQVSKASVEKETDEAPGHDEAESHPKGTAHDKAGAHAKGGSSAKGDAHDKHGSKATHSDIAAAVVFACAKDPAGSTLKVNLMQAFPLIKEVKVQLLSGAKQSAATLTAGKSELGL